MTDTSNVGDGELILVTGASGFIAKHTIQQALAAGYRVRGTVRNDDEATIAQTVVDQQSSKHKSYFSVVRADLTSDAGWKEAEAGCDYVLHIANPYPKTPTKRGGREALVAVSRDGTLRVLRAAFESPSVRRVVMVSSMVSVVYWPDRPTPTVQVSETDWTDPDWEKVTWAYAVAKTRAEKAAWELAKERELQDKLVSVNPAMVWGPVLDGVECTSSDICKDFLQGSLPVVAPMSWPLVDVRDVATLLVVSLKSVGVGGRRLIAAADTMDFLEVAKHLATTCPQFASKIPTRTAPHWLLRLLAWLGDPTSKQILPDLETRVTTDTSYVTELTGVTFRPSKEAVAAMAESLIGQKLVPLQE